MIIIGKGDHYLPFPVAAMQLFISLFFYYHTFAALLHFYNLFPLRGLPAVRQGLRVWNKMYFNHTPFIPPACRRQASKGEKTYLHKELFYFTLSPHTDSPLYFFNNLPVNHFTNEPLLPMAKYSKYDIVVRFQGSCILYRLLLPHHNNY